MSDRMDQIGHLTLKPDGTVYDGLCHCAQNRAHYADEDAPQGPMRATREQMQRVTRRVIYYHSSGEFPPPVDSEDGGDPS